MSKSDDVNFHSSVSDAYHSESDISFHDVPKNLNASSPSSICSTKPLEWDSGADVGYGIMPNVQSKELSTIERMAVNNFMFNANSTPIDSNKCYIIRSKSNSLSNLDDMRSSKNNKSLSCDQLKWVPDNLKLNTLPKNKSPMTSSFSLSTVVQKMNSSITKEKLVTSVNMTVATKQDENVEKTEVSSVSKSKSCESNKTSNSPIGSIASSESWEVKRYCDSNNTATDRVNSFEYLPGDFFYNGQQNDEECSDEEIEKSVLSLIKAMKQNGLTEKSKIKEVFREIYKNVLESKDKLHNKSSCDSNNLPENQDVTPQTSNTGNTVLNNEIDNHSSTIDFTSPVTSSQYGDGIDTSMYCDTNSLESGRHFNLQKCKIKNSTPTKHSRKIKNNTSDASKHFDKQVLNLHENFIKAECENQRSFINNQIIHLENLNKLLNTHKELQKNWNNYKEKQKLDIKPQLRKLLIPKINYQNNTNSTQTDNTTSYLNSSKCNSTEPESSSTICHHSHYKKGILVNNSMSLIKCCKNTVNLVSKKNLPEKPQEFKCMSVKSNTQLKDDKKPTFLSAGTYRVYKPIRTTNVDTKNSITYDIIFKPNQKEDLYSHESGFLSYNQLNCMKNKNKSKNIAKSNTKESALSTASLQEYLVTNRPDYIAQAQNRQKTLKELHELREQRKLLKRNVLLTNSEEVIPPNPLTIKRVMTQKEMRKQTEKKFRLCSEVKNKKIEKKRKDEYMNNKIMANIFNKKLQKKTLRGNVDLSNSVSVCSL